MQHVTDRVARRLRRDFGAKAERLAREIGEVAHSEREQAAVLLLAEGDEARLHQAMELARLDRRDLLTAAGLDQGDWARRLDHELGRTSRRTRPSTSRRWLRGCLLTVLVAPGLLFFLVGIPVLIVGDYHDETGRTGTTSGVVTVQRSGYSKSTRIHQCSYEYSVDGRQLTGDARCGEDDVAGETVEVRYDPQDPTSSDLGGRGLTGLVIGLGAVAICGVTLAAHAFGRRRRGRRVKP